MAELRRRAGSALLLALWALSLWLVGYYTLLLVVDRGPRRPRGLWHLAGLGVPVGVSAAALVYVAWRAVALVASI